MFAARFAYDFSKCIGIEILHGLHTQAVKVLERYNAEFKGQLAMGQSQHAAVYEVGLDLFYFYNFRIYYSRKPSIANLFVLMFLL